MAKALILNGCRMADALVFAEDAIGKQAPLPSHLKGPIDQGYTGPNAAEAAPTHGIRLEVVKHPMAEWGFLLLPRPWQVERSVEALDQGHSKPCAGTYSCS
jgi:hypothetical protein